MSIVKMVFIVLCLCSAGSTLGQSGQIRADNNSSGWGVYLVLENLNSQDTLMRTLSGSLLMDYYIENENNLSFLYEMPSMGYIHVQMEKDKTDKWTLISMHRVGVNPESLYGVVVKEENRVKYALSGLNKVLVTSRDTSYLVTPSESKWSTTSYLKK